MANGVQIIWTPWRNHDDLLRVRELLYATSPTEQSGNSSLRRKACDQVRMSTTLTESRIIELCLDIRMEATRQFASCCRVHLASY